MFAERDLQGGAASAPLFGGEDAPLSVKTVAGVPHWAKAWKKIAATSGPAGDAAGWAGHRQAGVVVEDVDDLHLGSVGEAPVVTSACQHSLDYSA